MKKIRRKNYEKNDNNEKLLHTHCQFLLLASVPEVFEHLC